MGAKRTMSFSILFLCCQILYFVHFFGCIWHYIGIKEKQSGIENNWIDQNSFDSSTKISSYVTSVYFTIITMSTIGFGDILPYHNNEKLYVIFQAICATGAFAYIINQVTGIMQEYTSLDDEYFDEHIENLYSLDQLMRIRGIEVKSDGRSESIDFLYNLLQPAFSKGEIEQFDSQQLAQLLFNTDQSIYASQPSQKFCTTFSTRCIFRMFNDHLMFGTSQDQYILKSLVSTGFWDRDTMDFLGHFARNATVLIDLGANMGAMTMAMSDRTQNGTVYAFEASPQIFSLLQDTFNERLNQKISQKVVVINKAAYHKNMQMGFHYKYRGASISHLADKGKTLNEKQTQLIEVEAVRVDQELERYGVKSAQLIKVDVEGAECGAIEGMKNIIKNSPDLILITEWVPERHSKLGYVTEDCYNMFKKELGLTIYKIVVNHEREREFGFHMYNFPK